MAHGKFGFYPAVFCVVSCFSVADINGEWNSLTKMSVQIFKKCSRETNLSEDWAPKIYGTTLMYDPIPDNDDVKCYFVCQQKGFRVMDNDGNILWDYLADMTKAEYAEEDHKKILQAIDTCRKIEKKSGDLCQRAYEFGTCFFGNLKKLNVSPILADISKVLSA